MLRLTRRQLLNAALLCVKRSGTNDVDADASTARCRTSAGGVPAGVVISPRRFCHEPSYRRENAPDVTATADATPVARGRWCR